MYVCRQFVVLKVPFVLYFVFLTTQIVNLYSFLQRNIALWVFNITVIAEIDELTILEFFFILLGIIKYNYLNMIILIDLFGIFVFS